MTSGCSQDAEGRSLLEQSRSTLYLGVDVRHPQAARCTRHALCANHWHSPRNCPNMALAKMSPYGSSGNDDSPPMTAEEEAAAMAALDAAGINGLCAISSFARSYSRIIMQAAAAEKVAVARVAAARVQRARTAAVKVVSRAPNAKVQASHRGAKGLRRRVMVSHNSNPISSRASSASLPYDFYA